MIRIKELRKERGLTLKSIAEALNTSHQVVSRYELERTQPDFATLIKIADFFGVTIDYLLGRTHEPTPTHKESGKFTVITPKTSTDGLTLEKDEKALIITLRRSNKGKEFIRAMLLMLGEERTIDEILKRA